MRIIIEIINKFGSFKSSEMAVNDDEYQTLLDNSKNFYKSGAGFEMFLESGFIVLTPSILNESILIIHTL